MLTWTTCYTNKGKAGKKPLEKISPYASFAVTFIGELRANNAVTQIELVDCDYEEALKLIARPKCLLPINHIANPTYDKC